MRRLRRADLLRPALALSVAAASVAAAGRLSQPDARATPPIAHQILVAEHARAGDPAQLALLRDATRHPTPDVQRAAIRALGRLERASMASDLVPLLSSSIAVVRSETANALAQLLTGPGADSDENAGKVSAALGAALDRERSFAVRGALLHALGRLPYRTPAERSAAEGRIGAALDPPPPAEVAIGALSGLEPLYRGLARGGAPNADVLARMARTFSAFGETSGADAARVRRLVLSASIAAGRAGGDLIRAASHDRDEQVRRLALLAAALPSTTIDRRPIVDEGLRDASAMVRVEALRVYGRQFQSSGCAPVTVAVADSSSAAALLALDLLGEPCPEAQTAVDLLARHAEGTEWRRASHALVSLARRAPDRARPLLARQLGSPVWQARMYAAHAASALKDADILLKLAADSHDNVREAAIAGLLAVRGHDADDQFIAALVRPDYQLVRTAARALQGTARRQVAADALVAAFDRITREDRDTSRDARIAILERLAEVGVAAHAASIQSCAATDFDPRVAQECAGMLRAWNVAVPPSAPRPVTRPGPPTADEIASLRGAIARVTMAGGRVFDLRLMPSEAPLTVARFARLARAGYYNGLTFHRIVPNFVIQGGSPGANEYVGDGPFMRDEVGLVSHLRGTVGISTRGRDTGDAQIFVNLVDNTRLDHTYTVFAEVTRGMSIVDEVQEGDVIERVEITR
jgi:cyclophilin family peptidyl-prolyl cis-trans isomerase/HEAT repeat protein